LDEIREGVNSGAITEIFACGTAAVITPIGLLKSKNEGIGSEDSKPGELTTALREQLTGIQYGRVEDKHGWMYRLSE
jgi:branched-chain amino acid aminotransferase